MDVILLLLTVSVVVVSEASSDACHKFIDRSGSSISSPNFPQNYNNNEKCTYHIAAPFGSVVTLYFNHLDLEGSLHGDKCHDTLQVNISDVSGKVPRTLCGFNLPSPIYSVGNEMFLTFQTDSTDTASGFHASIFFSKPAQPYFPTDGIYILLHVLAAVNIVLSIIVTLFVVSCCVLYKRNLLGRTQGKDQSPLLNTEPPIPCSPIPSPSAFKDGDDSSKDISSTPESCRRYLEMKPSFKRNKLTAKPGKHAKDTESIEAYARPVIKSSGNVQERRNTVEYSEPSNDIINSNVYQTNVAISKAEYSNTVIENNDSGPIQNSLKEISYTPESAQCYLEMNRNFNKNKVEDKPEDPLISTYGDHGSDDPPETIYASPIVKSSPQAAEKRDTVVYSEPSDVNIMNSNVCPNTSEYSKSIIGSSENNRT